MFLKINTSTEVDFFMPDDTDPWSGKTGLSSFTVSYKKQGQSSFSTLSSPTITEIGSGWYKLAVPSTLVDTAGFLVLVFSASGAKTQQRVFQVVSFDPYDANALGLSRIDATISSRSTITTGDVLGVITGNVGLTSTRAGYLDRLDVSVSTRSTLTTGDVLSVITGNVGLTSARASNLDRLDATISSVSGNTATAVWSASSGTNFGTSGMGTLIKTNLDATVSSRSTLTTGDVFTVITGNVGLTSTRAGYLDAAISSRLASSYGTTVDNIWSKTSGLQYEVGVYGTAVRSYVIDVDGGSGVDQFIASAVWATSTGTAWVAGSMGQLLSKLTFTGSNVNAQVAGMNSGVITSGAFATDAISSGAVSAGAVTKIAGGILSNTANKLYTDSSGRVRLDFSQSTTGSMTADTVGDALQTAAKLQLNAGNLVLASVGGYESGYSPDEMLITAKVDGFTLNGMMATSNLITSAMTGLGYTSGRAQSIDVLNMFSFIDQDGTYFVQSIADRVENPVSVDYFTSAGAVQSSQIVTGAMDTQGYTTGRASYLDIINSRLDATVSSRSTLTTGDVLSVITGNVGLTSTRASNLDRLDTTVSSRSTLTTGDVFTVITGNVGLTSTRAGYLDLINSRLDATISSVSGNTATAVWSASSGTNFGTSGMGTLIKTNLNATVSSRSTLTTGDVLTVITGNVGLTSTRASNLDRLDVNVSTRSTLTTGDVFGVITGNVGLTTTRAGYLDRLDATISSVSGNTAIAVWSTASGTNFGADTMGTLIKTNLDVPVSSIDPDTSTLVSTLTDIKNKTDQLTFVNDGVSYLLTIADRVENPVSVDYYTANGALQSTLVVTGALTAQGYTTGRADYLDLINSRLDVAVSSRSTLTSGDVLSVITGSVGLTSTRAGYLDRLDASISSVSGNTATAVWSASSGTNFGTSGMGTLVKTNLNATVSSRSTLTTGDVLTVITGNVGLTTTRAGNLDRLDASVSTRSTLTTGDVFAVITGNVGLTTTRAGYLDRLDATISSVSGNTATAVWSATSGTDFGTSGMGTLIKTNLDTTVSSRLASSAYVAPDNTNIANIWNRVNANLDATVSSRSTLTAADVWSYSTRQITDMTTGAGAVVWSVPSANVNVANSIGLRLRDNIDTTISSRSTLTTGDVFSVITGNVGLTTTRAGNLDRLDANVSTRSTLTTGDVLTVITGNVGLTSTRAGYLDAAISSIPVGVWSVASGAAFGTNAMGTFIKNYLDVPVSSIDPDTSNLVSDISAIKAKTDQMNFVNDGITYLLTIADRVEQPVAVDYLTANGALQSLQTVTGALNAQGYTTGRASYLDIINSRLDVAVSTRSTLTSGDVLTVITGNVGLTSTRAANLDRLDATVSSRSTLTTGDVFAVITGNVGLTSTRASNLDRLDAAISSVSGNTATAVWSATSGTNFGTSGMGTLIKTNLNATISSRSTLTTGDVLTVITGNVGLTSTRAGYLDLINSRLDVAVSSVSGNTATAVWSATSGTDFGTGAMGTLLKTNLDATVSSRLASSSYVAPDNTNILNIWNKVNTNLDTTVSSRSTLTAADVWTYSARQITDMTTGAAAVVWSVPSASVSATNSIGLRLRDNIDTTISSRSTLTTGDVLTVLTGNVGLTSTRAGYLDRLDATISSVSGNTANAVWSASSGTNFGTTGMGTLIKTNLDATVSSRLAATSYIAPPTVGAIADAVWDEPRTGHTTTDTFGSYLDMKISDVAVAAGIGDWTTDEKAQIRYALGIDGTQAAPTGNTGWLYNIYQKTQPLSFDSGRVVAKAEVVTDKSGYSLLNTEHTTITTNVLNSITGTLGFDTTKVGYIDAAISSRLAASSYQTPPAASDIATAVWSASTGTSFGTSGMGTLVKTNLDTPVSTRLAASSYVAPDNTNIANIWSRVNTNLDATVSSRSTLTAADVWSYSTRQITDMTTGAAAVVWGVPSASVNTANSIGLRLRDNIDTTISSRSTLTTGDVFNVITGNVGLTTTRAGYLDRLDATVSSVSGNTATAVWSASSGTNFGTSGMGTLIKTNLNATVSSRSTLTTGDVLSVITGNIGLTSTRASNLDRLDTNVSTRSTLTTGDVLTVITGNVGLTSTRAGYLDMAISSVPTSVWSVASGTSFGADGMGTFIKTNLDVPVSSVDPDTSALTSDVAAIKAKTDQLTFVNDGISYLLTIADRVEQPVSVDYYTAGAALQTTQITTGALNAQGYTTGRASYLDIINSRLDVAVSTRSALTSGDVLSVLTGNVGLTSDRAANLDLLDATVSSRSTLTTGDVLGVITGTVGLTTTRASNLDRLDAAVSTRSTLTTGDVLTVITGNVGLTSTRAGYLDRLDATISSVSGNTSTAVWSAASGTNFGTGAMGTLIKTNLDAAVSSRLASSSYIAPDNTNIANIWSRVNSYLDVAVSSRSTLTAADVWSYSSRGITAMTTGAAQSVWDVPTSSITGSSTIGLQVKTNLDVPVSTRLDSSSYNAPDNTTIGNIYSKVQNLTYDASNYILARTKVNEDKSGYALTSAEHANIISDVTSALDAQGYTTGRAQYIDTYISSRLASADYVAPPTTGQIASSVWSYSTRIVDLNLDQSVTGSATTGTIKERLQRIDDTISSRATSAQVLTVITGTVGLTPTRAGYLDMAISSVPTSVWSTSSGTGFGDSAMGTLVKTNLDATVSSRSTLTAADVWGYSTRQITSMTSGAALEVWNITTGNITATGTIGNLLKTNVDAAISSRATSAQVLSVLTGDVGLTSTRASNLDRLDVNVSSRLSASDIATIVDAVWDEPRTGHSTADTFGSYLDMKVSEVASAGVGDWNADEKAQIRYALGIDGTQTSPTGNAGWLYSVQQKVSQLTFTGGNVNANAQVVNDKAGYELSSSDKSSIASAIWNHAVRTLTQSVSAVVDPNAITAGLEGVGLTRKRVARLDYLDVPVSTRSERELVLALLGRR